MIFFVILLIIFFILLLLPFLISVLFNATGKVKPLVVRSDNIKDPRYFAKSFRALIEKALERENRVPGMLMLSREEPYIEGDGTPFIEEHCDKVVYEGRSSFLAERSIFDKEIYAAHDATIGSGTALRAIACLGHLRIQDKVRIERWADGEKGCRVGDGCDLGISLSGLGPITLGLDSRFRRIYAPMVHTGSDLPDRTEMDGHARRAGAVIKDILFDTDSIKAGDRLEKTIITKYDLLLSEGCAVFGSVKSSGSIHIMSDVLVTGSVIADGDIVLESGVSIQGNVFSQERIIVGSGTVIGLHGHIKSLIARKCIYLSEGATVYGYLGSEDESKVVDRDGFLSYANACF